MNTNKSWTNNQTTELFEGILTLRSVNEAENFFRDLMTFQEIEVFSSRFKVAKLLSEGNLSYREISQKTGMSTTTVTRINEWLERGNGGYKSVLSNIQLKPKEQGDKRRSDSPRSESLTKSGVVHHTNPQSAAS